MSNLTPSQSRAKSALDQLCDVTLILAGYSKKSSRQKGFSWLSSKLGISPRDLRIRDFDPATCERAVQFCNAFAKIEHHQSKKIDKRRLIDAEETGYFKLTLVRNGVEVGALRYLPCPIDPFFGYPLDRPRHLCAMINGKDADPEKVGEIWPIEPIKQGEYEYLIADRKCCAEYYPHLPEANPYEPVVKTPKAKAKAPARPAINIRDIPIQSFMP